jgi:hypothetical protein
MVDSSRKFFFSVSRVQFAQTNDHVFIFRHETFYFQLKSKVGNIITKVEDLCINLNR